MQRNLRDLSKDENVQQKKNPRTSVREFYPYYLRFGGLWIASPSTSAKASYIFSEKVG